MVLHAPRVKGLIWRTIKKDLLLTLILNSSGCSSENPSLVITSTRATEHPEGSESPDVPLTIGSSWLLATEQKEYFLSPSDWRYIVETDVSVSPLRENRYWQSIIGKELILRLVCSSVYTHLHWNFDTFQCSVHRWCHFHTGMRHTPQHRSHEYSYSSWSWLSSEILDLPHPVSSQWWMDDRQSHREHQDRLEGKVKHTGVQWNPQNR